MTPHMHRVLTPGCYRCDLNRDEIEAAREAEIEQQQREATCPGHEWLERSSRWGSWAVCRLCGAEDE